MSTLAQCGFGRSNKIELGIDGGVIHGMIMSPRDEARGRLEGAVHQLRQTYPSALILFDPQFYAATLNDPRDGHLNEYDYYKNNSGLSRTHFSMSQIRRYIEDSINYQFNSLGGNLSYLISPTIIFDDFRDSWSQIAINMAVESVAYRTALNGAPPLLISLVISETAFNSLEATQEFLDVLTELEVDGFYIIVRRNANSIQNAMEASSFARFMYFCYVLTEINEYAVIVGYSDWHSFLLESVGVNYTASGWYQNLRQFSLARFQPAAGGRRPRKRYSSVPLLSSPLITPELQDIFLARLLHNVLSGSSHDNILSQNGPAAGEPAWSDEIACLEHWYSMNRLSELIAPQGTVSERLDEALRLIQSADGLYLQLSQVGVSFDTSTGPNHIDEWRNSVQEFRRMTGV